MGSGWNRRKRSAVFRGAAAVALAASTAGAAANPSVLAQRGNDFSGYGSAKAVEILVPSGLPSGVTSNGHALLNAGSLLDGVVHGVGKTVSGITGELLGRDSLLNGVIDGVGHTVSGVAESLLGGLESPTGSNSGSGSGSSGQGGSPSPNDVGSDQDFGFSGLAGSPLEIGVALAAMDSTAGTPCKSEAYPLGMGPPGSGEVKPLRAYASAPPDSEDGGLLPAVDAAGGQGKLLNAHAKAVWEGSYPSSQASTSMGSLRVPGLLDLGALETSTSVETDESGVMVTTSRLRLAGISVAGVLNIDELDVAVTASATGQAGGARASADMSAVKLSVLGIPYEVQAGQVLNIPGVVRVSLGEVDKQEDPNGLSASISGSGLTIQLLSALFNGVTLNIGAVRADARVPEGGIQFASPYTLAKTAAQDSVEPGGDITYHLVYNIQQDLSHVEVKDVLPTHTKFVYADSGGRYDPGENAVFWDLGDQKKDSGGVLTVKVQVDPETKEGTIIRNVAEISAPGRKPETSQTVDVTVGPKVHVPFVIGFPDGTFRPGDPVTRAQLAAIVAHIMKLQDLTNQPITFTDVPVHHLSLRHICRCRR
ncbi:MAG: S-layer homology domain-containing protein, partial [Alicyclobacillaceae bacterium]|nr:S-layer homology domain-containing protein [Alicyclobacillaceae bacterium]